MLGSSKVAQRLLKTNVLVVTVTLQSRVLTGVYDMEINFIPKVNDIKFSLINNLKKPLYASKQDGLVLPTS